MYRHSPEASPAPQGAPGAQAQLDEGFVGTVKAYMKKASDDGLEGMVDVLRVLLHSCRRCFTATTQRNLECGARAECL